MNLSYLNSCKSNWSVGIKEKKKFCFIAKCCPLSVGQCRKKKKETDTLEKEIRNQMITMRWVEIIAKIPFIPWQSFPL